DGHSGRSQHQLAGARAVRFDLARQDLERGQNQRGADRRRLVGFHASHGADHGDRAGAVRAQHVARGRLQPTAPKMTAVPIFEVDDLRAHYLTRFGQKIQAVDGVTFSLKEGEILGIAGESGCGKTTLVSACMGLYIPPLHLSSGDVKVDGKSIIGMDVEQNRQDVLGRLVSMIPQGALNSLNPTRKVKDLATDMILSHDDRADKKEIQARLRDRFKKIGLDADLVLNSYPIQLPAGMKQRVVIGISTLLNPRV